MTVEEIRTYLFIIASEFKTTDSEDIASIDTLISNSMSNHNINILGINKYKNAVAYDVASQLSISGFKPVGSTSSTSTSQEVTKRKAGNIEISYSSNTVKKNINVTNASDLNPYAMKYQEIIRSIIFVPRNV